MSNFTATDEILDDIMGKICGVSCDYEECHCGRVTFNADHQSDDCGLPDAEDLRRRAEVEPDKYLEVDYSIPHIDLPWGETSISVVIGCPCGLAIKVARQWLDYRSTIGKFFSVYTDFVKNELTVQQGVMSRVNQG